jgi:hypothetical protein
MQAVVVDQVPTQSTDTVKGVTPQHTVRSETATLTRYVTYVTPCQCHVKVSGWLTVRLQGDVDIVEDAARSHRVVRF